MNEYCKGKPHTRYEILPPVTREYDPFQEKVGVCQVCKGKHTYPPISFEGTFNGSLESNPTVGDYRGMRA